MLDLKLELAELRRAAKLMGFPDAADLAVKMGRTTRRAFTRLLIVFSAARINASQKEDVFFMLAPKKDSADGSHGGSSLDYGDEWLLSGKPEGTVVPPASGRETVRTPNLKSANPSFAARLICHVRDRFDGDAPQVYRAACLSRKTYSSIVSNELRPVSKQTAIAFALALRLSFDEASELLRSAGHALSEFLLDDMIVKACIATGIYDVATVNKILSLHGANPLFS